MRFGILLLTGLLSCSGGDEEEDNCPFIPTTGGHSMLIENIDVTGHGDNYSHTKMDISGVTDGIDGIDGTNSANSAARSEGSLEDIAYRYVPTADDLAIDNKMYIQFGLELPDDVEMSPAEVYQRRSWIFKECGGEEIDYGVAGATHIFSITEGEPFFIVVEGCQGYCYLKAGDFPTG